ncbi:hypothetical protein BKA62DRAFT_372541 [Auriculariales sp. MPI-PUGE-AT-0066]|nr:hypothetical protein BKA62DRAFT_372541 [Auriculariales sp. MPI-PUGE-AT-0066]
MQSPLSALFSPPLPPSHPSLPVPQHRFPFDLCICKYPVSRLSESRYCFTCLPARSSSFHTRRRLSYCSCFCLRFSSFAYFSVCLAFSFLLCVCIFLLSAVEYTPSSAPPFLHLHLIPPLSWTMCCSLIRPQSCLASNYDYYLSIIPHVTSRPRHRASV